MSEFVELKTTEGQIIHVRKDSVRVFEVVPASARVEGHIKIYIDGFKFLVSIEKDDLVKKLAGR